MQLDSEGLRSLAFGFKRRAWRLEVLQAYSIENEKEEFEKFLRGEKPPADYEYPWRDYVKKATGEGKTMGRVHLVTRPLTDYVRYQFDWGYAHTVPVGEDVRILDLSTTPNPAWCQVVDAPPASSSLDKESVEDFGRFLPVECLSWTVVEFVGDGVEFGLCVA